MCRDDQPAHESKMLKAAQYRLVGPTAKFCQDLHLREDIKEIEHPMFGPTGTCVAISITQEEAAMKHVKRPKIVTTAVSILVASSVLALASEGLAFPVAPSALTYNASSANPMPASQTVTFSKNSLVPRPWTASGDAAWLTVSPASGTIAREQDQIAVLVNASGMAAGTYSGTVRITVVDKNDRAQVTPVLVTLIVSGATATSTSTSTVTPSILLNPTSLSFSGVAGGPPPLAKPLTVSNPTGGTLTWTMTETAAWLGLNIMSGTTTTETDSISASVSTTGLAAGTYSTVITISASGSSNSPQAIPVTLTVTPPTTAGTATLTWSANTEPDVNAYKVYMGTQPGVYGAPISVGNVTSYTVGNLAGGTTYYFSVTALNSSGGESLHSAEVSKPVY
jgi:BACON domain-containing protein/fibronectin type III domain protein